MLPREVGYARPSTLGEALELLASHDGARPLAGGQTLVNVMKARVASPDALVDLEVQDHAACRLEVDDVDARADHARAIGATVAWGPAVTDWGTYSALVQGPHGTLVDFYRLTT